MDQRRRFAHSAHLVRVALLFFAGFAAFLGLRALLVPADFGQLGHYRAGSLADNRAKMPRYAGRQACADCHAQADDQKHGRADRPLSCEGCHGPLAAHAAAPDEVQPKKPDAKSATALCLRCHGADPAKPAAFPQIDPAAHSEGADCIDCHDPHAPAP